MLAKAEEQKTLVPLEEDRLVDEVIKLRVRFVIDGTSFNLG